MRRQFFVACLCLLLGGVQADAFMPGGASGSAGAGGSCASPGAAAGCAIAAPTSATLIDNAGTTYHFNNGVTQGNNYQIADQTAATYGTGRVLVIGADLHVYRRASYAVEPNTGWVDLTGFPGPGTPVATITASSAAISVTQAGSAVSLGLSCPSDTLYASSALTITADYLPQNGTLTLVDGVTPVTQGQTLTCAQLTGLKLVPSSSFLGNSNFTYSVVDPATVFAYGDVSVSMKPSGLWADPPNIALAANVPAGVDVLPVFTQPSISGDIVGVTAQNVSGSVATTANGWYTFGHVWRDGDVLSTDVLVLKEGGGTKHYCQRDQKTTHPDGTSRYDVLTCQFPAVSANSSTSFLIVKCTSSCPAAPSPAAPTAAALIAAGYGATETITFSNGVSASKPCATMLSGASPSNLSGSAVNEFDVSSSVAGGGNGLRVECQVRAYANGTVHTKIVVWNSSYPSAPTNLVYDISLGDGFSAAAIQHYDYAVWSHDIFDTTTATQPIIPVDAICRGRCTGTLNLQFDTPYWIATGALLPYDLSYGAQDTPQISNDQSITSNHNASTASVAPLYRGGIMATKMGDTNGRQDIGTLPNWNIEWIRSQNSKARIVVTLQDEAGGSIPWHYIDSATLKTINTETNAIDVRGLENSGPGVNPAGCSAAGNCWSTAPDHMPQMNYLSYLMTGAKLHLDKLQSQGTYAAAIITNYATSMTLDDVMPTRWANTRQDASSFSANGSNQIRAFAWESRALALTAYAAPDADTLRSHFLRELSYGLHGANFMYDTRGPNWEGDNFWVPFGSVYSGDYGAIKGFLHYWGDSRTGEILPYHHDYAVSALGMIARLGLPPIQLIGAQTPAPGTPTVAAGAQALRLLGFMSNYMLGSVTSGQKGYDPFLATPYQIQTCVPPGGSGCTNLPPVSSTWAALTTSGFNASWAQGVGGIPAPGSLNENTDPMPNFCGGAPNAQAGFANGFPELRFLSASIMTSVLGTPQAYQAWAYLWPRIVKCFSVQSLSQVGDATMNGQFLAPPILPNGKQVFTGPYGAAQPVVVDATNGGTVTVNSNCNGLTAIIGTGTATINGCNSGGYEIMAAGSGATTMNAGTGTNTDMFGGLGATTFVDNTGNNYMQSGAMGYAASGPSSVGVATYQFGTNGSGQDTIANFRPGTDKLKIKSTLDGGSWSAASFLAAGATVSGSCVFAAGGGNTITTTGVSCASISTGDITIF